ncbi:hypothetical protein ATO6_00055 [Oceanicola sp. 22II-s10i]|uniref:hypothetical protein n=1 Tax=Oceanicola sp. 22II-s10i TaxID=1317116 RepID=UPI000B52852D|nr:hypothetical protein [Oceanicola sp. 22II-s10i]OWU85395.1 hypothetical protein ATO6_00055 [Oceanicola sp. 22II-s10i]
MQIVTLTAAIAMAILATQSAAQGTPCAPRHNVVEGLAEKYGENRRAIGVSANNMVVEVFASDASGTWTITVTNASGLTCLVASGEAFEALAESLPDLSDPA